MAVAFTLFGLEVKWYGIIIAFGVLVACIIAMYNTKRKKLSEDLTFELLLCCFPLAIIGARIFYICFSGDSYSFAQAIAIWNGGMSIIGGIIGGVIGLGIYCYFKKMNILEMMDVIAPSLIIAQSIGRWGNFANQEVYGTIVTDPNLQFFPFSVFIDILGEWHYATFFYESMLNLAGFFLLMYLFKKSQIKGIVASTYLIFYGVVRFFLEGLRQPSEILFIDGTNIMISQVFSLVFVVVGVSLFAYLLIKKKKSMLKTNEKEITKTDKKEQ